LHYSNTAGPGNRAQTIRAVGVTAGQYDSDDMRTVYRHRALKERIGLTMEGMTKLGCHPSSSFTVWSRE
jgi:hypothetical protein